MAQKGATAVARTKDVSLVTLVDRLIEADGTADAKRLFKAYVAVLRRDGDYFEASALSSFTNAYAQWEREHKEVKRSLTLVRAERATAATQTLRRLSNVIYLNLPMPNGKKLRYCTFKEVAAFAGWAGKLAKLGKPDQLVGDVLDEDDVAKIMVAK